MLICFVIFCESFYFRCDFLLFLWLVMFFVMYLMWNMIFDNCIWLYVNEDKGWFFVVCYLLRDFIFFVYLVVIWWFVFCKVEWWCFRVMFVFLVRLFCNGKLIILVCDCIVGYLININIINGNNEWYFWCNWLFCCL